MNIDMEKERVYLERVKTAIEKEIEEQKEAFIKVPFLYKGRYADVKWGDEDLVEFRQKEIIRRLKKIEKLSSKPYFGNFSFLEDGEQQEEVYYIGKTNILDSNTKESLVVDWRSPICTLYYDQSLGRVSYQCPKGEINGNLTSKKQILIEDGKLIRVYDTDLVTDDELLLTYLSTNADSRLKNIVASIQSEQNAIIRKPMNHSIIVQGVAGSGKTTVALHRAAYLLYNNSSISAKDFAIIGPNPYFLNYISALLPDLDTENINAYTYQGLFEEYFDQKYSIERDRQGVTDSFLKYKNSVVFKNKIDEFMKNFVSNNLHGGISLCGYEILSEENILRILQDVQPLQAALDRLMKGIPKAIKDNYNDLYHKITLNYRRELVFLDKVDPRREEILQILDKVDKSLKNGCSSEIKEYLKPYRIDTMRLYKQFIESIDIEEFSDKEVLNFKKESLVSIKKKKFYLEEVPGIMYIDCFLHGITYQKKNIRHVIVDEAQDLGTFHYYMLKQIFPYSTYSIYGDLAQSIYPSIALDSWEELNSLVFQNQCEILKLDKSYRTTKEITISANNILRHLGLMEATPVIRSGDEVSYQEEYDFSNDIVPIMNKYKMNKYKTIAIICKDDSVAKKYNEIFLKEHIPAKLIHSSDLEYNGGICILTSELAKGLEFDAVVIPDADNDHYSSANEKDMHLLYVAMTRALHSLSIYSPKKLSDVFETHNKVYKKM